MKKKIWVLNYKMTDLQSVENISSALVQAYRSLAPEFDVTVIELEDFFSPRTLLLAAKDERPNAVAVVHPSVNHHIFFQSLMCLEIRFHLMIHVFGNFFRNGDLWFRQNHLLKNKTVTFIAASDSYQRILEHFIPKAHLERMPFPVQLAPQAMTQKRDSQVLKVLYAGRYHDQKNVSALIQVLSGYVEASGKEVRLTIMGSFDDFNPTTIQKNKIQGEQYQEYLQALTKKNERLKVKLLPHGAFEELLRQFETHDLFFSLSTFLDEDFGCVVAEALCAGLPCVLTRWGGYENFSRLFPEICTSIKVTMNHNDFLIDDDECKNALIKAAAISTDQKAVGTQRARSYFSPAAFTVRLRIIVERTADFTGFDPALEAFALSLKKTESVENFKKYYAPFWDFEGGV